jgi:hypothetical protein
MESSLPILPLVLVGAVFFLYQAWVGMALLAAAIIGSSIYQGEESRKASSKGARLQKEAQRQSLLAAGNAEKLAAQRDAAVNQRKPDLSSVMFAEATRGGMGPASTILAGRDGSSGTLLGQKSMLGG